MKAVASLAPAWQPGTQPSGLWGWGGPQPAGPKGADPRAWYGSPCTALRLTDSPRNPCRGMNPHTSWPLKQSRGSADCGPYMGKADPDLGEHKLSIYLHKVTQGISAQRATSQTGVFILHRINIPLRHLNRSATSRDDAVTACQVRKLCPFRRPRRTLMCTDDVHAIRPGRGGLGALLGVMKPLAL